MGRSRGGFQSADVDLTQRSRRKKNAPSGENSTNGGHGTGKEKMAFYHCNYCNKDITGKIRIKCAVCSDFDLCAECFSVGAEVTPHESNHPYRVMDDLSFPLLCPDWSADEEMLLLEGIEMYGPCDWEEVAEHVGAKSKEQCIDHYTNVYLNSPCFPLPDMSGIVGKSKNELLAMAKEQIVDKIGFSVPRDITLKEDSPFSPSRVKVDDSNKGGPPGRLLSTSHTEVDSGANSNGSGAVAVAAVNKASDMTHVKDGLNAIKIADLQTDPSLKGKRPNSSASEGPSLIELSGYNPKRQEFDPEYDNDAEQLVAEMEFKETDTEDERELKLRMLHIYIKRLDERKSRKDFILERNLLYPNPVEADMSPEERQICRRFDVFMRFHSKEEHNEMLESIVAEHRIRKRIEELLEARSAGCRSAAEADRYLEQKRKREAEECRRSAKESAQLGPSGQEGVSMVMASESVGRDSNSENAGQASSNSINDMDILGLPGADLLSETEKRLCQEIRILPAHYLKMQEIMSVEIINGNITKKSDAHQLFKVEAAKVDRVYDMLVKKGIA